MLRHLWNENELVGEFVAALIPHCRRGFGANIRTLGVLDEDDQLIAGIVYHNWDVEAGLMEISGAATHPRWLSRRTLMLMHCYPFGVDCKCQMIVQRIPADNVRLLSIVKRYGYELREIPRLFGRHRNGVVATLTDEAWFNNLFNRELREEAMRDAA